ncbi:hypothetical protein LDENG_00215220, partial [Lucifuga dentata]
MVTETIKDVALLCIMTGCCITNRHGIAQISVITKEIRTNSQQPSHLLIGPAGKQKCQSCSWLYTVFPAFLKRSFSKNVLPVNQFLLLLQPLCIKKTTG